MPQKPDTHFKMYEDQCDEWWGEEQHLQDAAVCNVMSGVSTVCLWDQIRWISWSRTAMFILVSGMTYVSWRRVKWAVLIDSLARMKRCREEAPVQCSTVWGVRRGELQVVWGESAHLHLDPRDDFTWVGRITFLSMMGEPTSGQPKFFSVVMQHISAVVCAVHLCSVSPRVFILRQPQILSVSSPPLPPLPSTPYSSGRWRIKPQWDVKYRPTCLVHFLFTLCTSLFQNSVTFLINHSQSRTPRVKRHK